MIVVTGATGNVGRRLVELLLAEGQEVRALTRSVATADLPEGAEVLSSAVPETALIGASAVFMHAAALAGGAAEFLALARERGVRRAVLLSTQSVRDDVERQLDPIGEMHKVIEDAIEASGLEWTFLRPGEFAMNAATQWGPQIRATGAVRGAYGTAASSPIHERDIAAVAARTLLDDGHTGARYALTGPESLTQIDKVRIIGEVAGRPLRFEEITPQAARKEMVENGLPDFIAEIVLDDLAQKVGRAAPISPVTEQVTGRPGLTFAEWAKEHAHAFARGE